MREWFTPAERRLALLLFVLSALGSSAHCARRFSPEVTVWLDGAGREGGSAPREGVSRPGSPVSRGGMGRGREKPAPAGRRSVESGVRARESRVNPNTAGEKDLTTLPGIGPALARRIVADRKRNGPYRRPEDLLRVRGIGPATLGRLRDRLDLP